MGKLHLLAEKFVVPEGFVRPRMDFAGLMGAAHGGRLADLQGMVPTGDRRLIERAAARVREKLESLGEDAGDFGLIHADLHAKNYLFERGLVHAIDFDACSFGYYLSDIAATTRMIRHPRIPAPQVLAEFLHGYRQQRDFTAAAEEHLRLFKVANSLMLAIWMTSRRDNPLLRSQAEEFIRFQLEQIEQYLTYF